MWELVEIIVQWFKHKKWPLPLLLIIILIVLTFVWSALSLKKEPPQVSIPAPESRSIPAPEIAVPEPNSLHKHPEKEVPKQHIVRENKNHDHQKEEIQGGNVEHFKNSLTDHLKIEGLDPQVADKIFKHIRAQLEIENSQYELADSVRAVMPDLGDEEVYRVRDLISNVMAESFETNQNR